MNTVWKIALVGMTVAWSGAAWAAEPLVDVGWVKENTGKDGSRPSINVRTRRLVVPLKPRTLKLKS